MNVTGNPASDRLRLPFAASLAVFVAVCLAALSLLGWEVRRELRTLQSAPRDNLQWTLSQMEVDLLVLDRNVQAVMAEQTPDLDRVRRRFDTLYSRVDTLMTGDFYRSLARQNAALSSIAGIKASLDGWVPLVDGADADLRRNLPDLSRMLDGMRLSIRDVGLEGVAVLAQIADERRHRLSSLLLQTAVLATVSILALVVALFFLCRTYRISLRRGREIEDVKERLASAFDASLDAIVVSDAQARIVEYNPAAEIVFGFPRAEALGRDVMDLIVPDRLHEQYRTARQTFLRTGENAIVNRGRIEAAALHKDGHEFPVEMSVGAALGRDGPIFIAYARDISERQEIERQLRAARDDAQAADRAKSGFLAVMSHEMRTPLNGILGVIDLLEVAGLDGEQRHLLGLAKSSGEVLKRHIDDVLDIAKAESGKLDLHLQPFDLVAVVCEVVETFRPQAAAKKNRLCFSAQIEKGGGIVVGDELRIRQIILNLVSNAVKFTEGGDIDVLVTLDVDGPEHYRVRLEVRDAGIGIARQHLGRIFDDFVTLDASYQRICSGTGLGLGITRRIVEAMGGIIVVDSEVGIGSQFRVELPLAIGKMPHRTTDDVGHVVPPPSDNAPSPRLALVVEDNSTNAVILRRMLEGLGWQVEEADNGRAGVELANRRSFDVIFMDISMPGMDGLEATRSVRSGSGLSARAPIIGITAHVSSSDLQRARDAGMDRCLTKPFRRHDLGSVLDLLGQNTPAQSEGGAFEKVPENAADYVDDTMIEELLGIFSREELQIKIAAFVSDMEPGLEKLGASLESGDRAAAAAVAHRLAGASAALGAVALRGILQSIEQKATTSSIPALESLRQDAAIVAASSAGCLYRLTLPHFRNG